MQERGRSDVSTKYTVDVWTYCCHLPKITNERDLCWLFLMFFWQVLFLVRKLFKLVKIAFCFLFSQNLSMHFFTEDSLFWWAYYPNLCSVISSRIPKPNIKNRCNILKCIKSNCPAGIWTQNSNWLNLQTLNPLCSSSTKTFFTNKFWRFMGAHSNQNWRR